MLPLSLLGFATAFLYPLLGKGLLALAHEGMHALMKWLEFLQVLPFAFLEGAYSRFWFSACLMAALLAVLACAYRLAAVFSIATMVFIIWPWHSHSLDEGLFRAHILDVGQGLAIVIETKDHAMLYDTGPSRGKQGNTGKMSLHHTYLSTVSTTSIN